MPPACGHRDRGPDLVRRTARTRARRSAERAPRLLASGLPPRCRLRSSLVPRSSVQAAPRPFGSLGEGGIAPVWLAHRLSLAGDLVGVATAASPADDGGGADDGDRRPGGGRRDRGLLARDPAAGRAYGPAADRAGRADLLVGEPGTPAGLRSVAQSTTQGYTTYRRSIAGAGVTPTRCSRCAVPNVSLAGSSILFSPLSSSTSSCSSQPSQPTAKSPSIPPPT